MLGDSLCRNCPKQKINEHLTKQLQAMKQSLIQEKKAHIQTVLALKDTKAELHGLKLRYREMVDCLIYMTDKVLGNE